MPGETRSYRLVGAGTGQSGQQRGLLRRHGVDHVGIVEGIGLQRFPGNAAEYRNGASSVPWAPPRSSGSSVRKPRPRPASVWSAAARRGNRSAAARVRGRHTTRSEPMTTKWNCP
ncbi:hypothetical protein GCM10017688_40860 [Streptomyces ramulosus]